MATLTFILITCTMPPAPRHDTPDFRLQAYYKQPSTEFCYQWHPDRQVMRDRRWAAKLALEVAKRGQSK